MNTVVVLSEVRCMKKVLNGVLYDSDRAKQVGVHGSLSAGNKVKMETLFKTGDGHYFIQDRDMLNGMNINLGKITPLSPEEAEAWAKINLGEYPYNAEFGAGIPASAPAMQATATARPANTSAMQASTAARQTTTVVRQANTAARQTNAVTRSAATTGTASAAAKQVGIPKMLQISLPSDIVHKLEQLQKAQGKTIAQVIESMLNKEGQ